jgi:hypothetical protein
VGGAPSDGSDADDQADFRAPFEHGWADLDPDSVVGKELIEDFEQLDESFTGKNKGWSAIVKLIGLTAMCAKGVIEMEREVIELRREVRSGGQR